MFGKNATQKSSSSYRRLNAKRRRKRRPRRNRKREKRRGPPPPEDRRRLSAYFFILRLGVSRRKLYNINGVFRRRPESDASKAPPRVPRCQTTTSRAENPRGRRKRRFRRRRRRFRRRRQNGRRPTRAHAHRGERATIETRTQPTSAVSRTRKSR